MSRFVLSPLERGGFPPEADPPRAERKVLRTINNLLSKYRTSPTPPFKGGQFMYDAVALFSIVLFGLVLRLVNLGVESFWGDEALSLDIVKHYQGNLQGMVRYLAAVEIHPPFYYILLKYWTMLFGFSEAAVRSVSVIFGLGTIIAVYYLGKELFKDKKIGILSALITAVLPMQIEYSQEARPYIIYCFFGVLTTLFLWKHLTQLFSSPSFKGGFPPKADPPRAERKVLRTINNFLSKYKTSPTPSPIRSRTGSLEGGQIEIFYRNKFLFLFVISGALGLYFHYSFLFIMAGLFLYWLLVVLSEKDRSREFVIWLTAMSGIFLAFYWWFTPFLYKMVLSWQSIIGTERTADVLRSVNFFESVINQIVWLVIDKKVAAFEVFVILIFKILLIGSIFWLVYKRKESLKEINWRYNGFIFLGLIFITNMIFFLFSPQSQNYSIIFERHLIFNSIIFAIFLAAILAKLPKKIAVYIFAIFILSIMNFDIKVMADDSTFDSFHNLSDLGEYMNLNYRKGDIAITYLAFGRTDLNHYLRSELSFIGLYPIYSMDNDLYSSRDTLGFMENESQLRIIKPAEELSNLKMDYIMKKHKPERVWVYGTDTVVNKWFERHNWRIAMKSLGEMFPVWLYAKP